MKQAGSGRVASFEKSRKLEKKEHLMKILKKKEFQTSFFTRVMLNLVELAEEYYPIYQKQVNVYYRQEDWGSLLFGPKEGVPCHTPFRFA
ncbi:MAG: hypothetical protein HY202_04265 [Nitrospirae bacterium]|nr:hypothetical protein [Nitrospirota bacterium]